MCGDWCRAEVESPFSLPGDAAASGASCLHPDPEACVGDFCCISCEAYLRFVHTNDVNCACHEFSNAKCFSNNCEPCADECLPPHLRDKDGPLGTGLLCVKGKQCEPCCQNKHDRGCKLECPCSDKGGDCALPDGQVVDYRKL